MSLCSLNLFLLLGAPQGYILLKLALNSKVESPHACFPALLAKLSLAVHLLVLWNGRYQAPPCCWLGSKDKQGSRVSLCLPLSLCLTVTLWFCPKPLGHQSHSDAKDGCCLHRDKLLSGLGGKWMTHGGGGGSAVLEEVGYKYIKACLPSPGSSTSLAGIYREPQPSLTPNFNDVH